MALIKGVGVILYRKIKSGTDALGNPLYEEKPVNINNVLIAPVKSDDVINTLNLTGKKAIYKLAIPKDDTNDWEDVTVEFFGKKWHTFGFSLEGINSLIPLNWNKKVMVERYED